MVAGKIFIGCAIALFVANMVYYAIFPEKLAESLVSGLVGGLVIAVGFGALLGVQAFTISLSDSFVKVAIAMLTMIGIFFKVDVGTVSVGLGFVTNLTSLFAEGDFLGIGSMVITVLSLTMLICGIMILNGGD